MAWTRVLFAALLSIVAGSFAANPLAAQQVTARAPLVDSRSGFYEYYGIDWGFRTRGPNGYFFFNRGGSAGAIPPYGGYDPNAAARLGFGNGNFFFNLTAAQGSRRSITSSTPSLTVVNGGAGAISSTSLVPFVTGLVPVVGDGAMAAGYAGPIAAPVPLTITSPLQEKLTRLAAEQTAGGSREPATDTDELNLIGGKGDSDAAAAVATGGASRVGTSTAEHGDVSVAELRRARASADQAAQRELRTLLEQAQQAEQAGRFGAARIFYQQAASRATGDLQRRLNERVAALAGK